jgi:fatty-acyl-CoA synthase
MVAFDWLARRAQLSPDKSALVDTATGRRFTYARFHERASRFGEFIRDEWGIRPGERVRRWCSLATPAT